jgi:hypothetical protein
MWTKEIAAQILKGIMARCDEPWPEFDRHMMIEILFLCLRRHTVSS